MDFKGLLADSAERVIDCPRLLELLGGVVGESSTNPRTDRLRNAWSQFGVCELFAFERSHISGMPQSIDGNSN